MLFSLLKGRKSRQLQRTLPLSNDAMNDGAVRVPTHQKSFPQAAKLIKWSTMIRAICIVAAVVSIIGLWNFLSFSKAINNTGGSSNTPPLAQQATTRIPSYTQNPSQTHLQSAHERVVGVVNDNYHRVASPQAHLVPSEASHVQPTRSAAVDKPRPEEQQISVFQNNLHSSTLPPSNSAELLSALFGVQPNSEDASLWFLRQRSASNFGSESDSAWQLKGRCRTISYFESLVVSALAVDSGYLLVNNFNLKSNDYLPDKVIQTDAGVSVRASMQEKQSACIRKCSQTAGCDAFVLVAEDSVCQLRLDVGSSHSRAYYFVEEPRRVAGVRLASHGMAQITRQLFQSLHNDYSSEVERCFRIDDALKQRNTRLFVSLTTIPSRALGIGDTLESILRQHLVPDGVIVAIPRVWRRFNDSNPTGKASDKSQRTSSSDQRELPIDVVDQIASSTWWNQLQSSAPHSRWIEIIRPAEDYGPATKLIPAALTVLSNTPNDLIITVDDDDGYFTGVTLNLAHYALQYPECILAHLGYNLKNPPYRHPNFDYRDATKRNVPEPIQIIAGFRGVLYRPAFFLPRSPVQNSSASSLSHAENGTQISALLSMFATYPEGRYVDDDYISGVADSLKVRRLLVPSPANAFYYMVPKQANDDNSLSSGKNKFSNIDRQQALITRMVDNGLFKRQSGIPRAQQY